MSLNKSSSWVRSYSYEKIRVNDLLQLRACYVLSKIFKIYDTTHFKYCQTTTTVKHFDDPNFAKKLSLKSQFVTISKAFNSCKF